VGGNLTRLLRTLGTGFEIDTRDRILFLEEVDEGHMQIDGDLNHLRLAGKFENVKGVVFSEMSRCLSGRRKDMMTFLRRHFKNDNFPVLFGLPSGHGIENITIPFGIKARLTSEPPRLTLEESGVR
jgi:muramoyltetrapeptide carboxypeptidase